MLSPLSFLSSLPSTAQPVSAAQSATSSQTPSTAATAGSATATAPGNQLAADTVTISSAAQQALQELAETPAKTQQEAFSGDLQAQRLLAKEIAAAKAEYA